MSIQIKTTGVHHVSLRVTDLPRAKKFYTETLGFEVMYVRGAPDFAMLRARSSAVDA